MMERSQLIRRNKLQMPLAIKIKDHCRKFTAFMFSNVGIILLVILYTIAGAFIFIAIEGNAAVEKWHSLNKQKQLVEKLWKFTCCEENIFDDKAYKEFIQKLLQRYQDTIVIAARKGWQGIEHTREGSETGQWSFSSAFLYSLTVITTIGYGNIAPQTELGKLMTILYAIVGMPLFLLYLSNIGDILAKSFKWVYAKFCLCRVCPGVARRRALRRLSKHGISETTMGHEDSEDPSIGTHTTTVPLTICIMIMIGYILFGASLFGRWENWDWLDGSYFCFISLSSIGFGDIVPGLSLRESNNNGRLVDISFILCAVYLLLGMALIAMCFSLMQEQVVYKIRSMKRCMKSCCNCGKTYVER